MFYYLWDVPIFMAMGAVGGVMGAGFCHFNVKVTQFRHKCGNRSADRHYKAVDLWLLYCSLQAQVSSASITLTKLGFQGHVPASQLGLRRQICRTALK